MSRKQLENRTVIESRTVNGVLHQLEYVRCGKARCRCKIGVLHGPYWYAYRWRKKTRRWVSTYVGKKMVNE